MLTWAGGVPICMGAVLGGADVCTDCGTEVRVGGADETTMPPFTYCAVCVGAKLVTADGAFCVGISATEAGFLTSPSASFFG